MTNTLDLIEIDWLKNNFAKANLKVIDSSWYLPTIKRLPKKEFQNCHINGAIYFDIEEISKIDSSLPHMVPEENQFAKPLRVLPGFSPRHFFFFFFLSPRAVAGGMLIR